MIDRSARRSIPRQGQIFRSDRLLGERSSNTKVEPMRAREVNPDPPARAPHELAADVEAELGSADAARHVRISAVKALEDAGLLVPSAADPLVVAAEARCPRT